MESSDVSNSICELRINGRIYSKSKLLSFLYFLVFQITRVTATDDCFYKLSTMNGELQRSLSDHTLTNCGCSSLYVKKNTDTRISVLDKELQSHLSCEECNAWSLVGNMAYMIPNDRRTFRESRNLCQKCGGDIAVFNTTDLRSTIEVIMNQISDGQSSLWIGIIRVQPQRVLFEWLDKRNFSVTDSSWDWDQPNDSTGEQDCVSSFSSNSWRLEDKRCTDKYFALCQSYAPP